MWGVEHSTPKLRELTLTVGRIVKDFSSGMRESATKGRGPEFVNYREYDPSDTTRDIAWRASARLADEDAILSQDFAPERQMRVLIVADESRSMHAPASKPIYAHALVRLFALAAIENDDPFAIVGLGGDEMIYSGLLHGEDDLDVLLRSADVPKQRRALRPSVPKFAEVLDEIGLTNLLVIFLTDLTSIDSVPLNALREVKEGQNVRSVAVVLDEWSGFEPSSHSIVLQHTGSGKVATLDMRRGGGIDREVRAFQDRLQYLRERKLLGAVLSVPLAGDDPLRSFYRQWVRYFEAD